MDQGKARAFRSRHLEAQPRAASIRRPERDAAKPTNIPRDLAALVRCASREFEEIGLDSKNRAFVGRARTPGETRVGNARARRCVNETKTLEDRTTRETLTTNTTTTATTVLVRAKRPTPKTKPAASRRRRRPPRGGFRRSPASLPLKLAVAGAASLSLLAGAVPDALATTSPALDAAALYQKVEPPRAAKSRFAGTEAEALKNQKLGKASAPAPKASVASTARSTTKTSKQAAKKAPKKKDNGGSAGALAAVVALAGVFAANATRGDKGGSSSGSAASAAAKPASAADGDTPAARAASAQAWIDASDFGKSGGVAADTPEGRAADAQKWIDEWQKGQ